MMLANGIAHISYHGGGVFLPARTPYDRELMVDCVADLVPAKGVIQVIVEPAGPREAIGRGNVPVALRQRR